MFWYYKMYNCYLLHSNAVKIHQRTCRSLGHHMRTADKSTPRDLSRTRFNTCKNSSAKAKPTYIQKRNSQLEAEMLTIHVQEQSHKQKHFSRLLTSTLCTKRKETPWMKFALSPQHTAIALSEIWNFGTPKGTVWTQTQWEETESRPMLVFCNFFFPNTFHLPQYR